MVEVTVKTNKVGKPRRAKKLAQKTSLKIDPDTRDILKAEFGSLGNALFFTAQGIIELRKKHSEAYKSISSIKADIKDTKIGTAEVLLVLRGLRSLLRSKRGTPYADTRKDIKELTDKLLAAINEEEIKK